MKHSVSAMELYCIAEMKISLKQNQSPQLFAMRDIYSLVMAQEHVKTVENGLGHPLIAEVHFYTPF